MSAPSLGSKIKELRLLRKLTLKQVADLADCTPSYISQIENDKTSPSIAALKKVATALDARIVDFFLAEEEFDNPVVFDPESWVKVSLPRWKANIRQMVRSVKNYQMQPFYTIIEPGGGTQEDYWHSGEEFGLVLEGELTLRVGKDTYVVKEGSAFYYPSVVSHAWTNEGDLDCKVVWVVTPPSW